jgi:hypothetical protein
MLHHMLRAAAQRAFNVLDPYFQYVTMLLHGDGTNGAQNNTFLDSSTNNFSITRNGNTTQGTFSPYGSNWSNYFNATTDKLTLTGPNLSGLTNFTFECWVFFNGFQADAKYFLAVSGGTYYQLVHDSSGGISLRASSGYIKVVGESSNSGWTTGVWYHVALVKNGNDYTIYKNGVSIATNTYSTALPSVAINYLGGFDSTTGLNAYMSNARITNTAVYTSSFTPSTTPLTAISGTQLLTCQSNRFIDNSTNAYALTAVGSPSVQRFSPFSPTSAYSTSVIGGSGYFDGTGDYLALPANSCLVGANDFTLESWVYVPDRAAEYVVFNSQSNASTAAGSSYGYGINTDGTLYTYFYVGSSTYNITSTGTVPINAWSHVALVRTGGTVSLFINGVRDGTRSDISTLSINAGATNYPPCIGINTIYYIFKGYISNLRLLVGSGGYNATSSTITIPTAPLTAVTNTQVLSNFTNAGILDNAMMNDLETVGNAQISTSVKKYGTGSMLFDGSGDGLSAPANINLAMGTGDFTIEMWVYGANSGSIVGGAYPRIFQLGAPQTVNTIECYNASGTMYVEILGTGITFTASTLLNSTWNHFAVTRASNSVRAFVNGTQVGSTTTMTNNLTSPITNTSFIGASTASSGNFNGYIDDVRITKGVARYTATFTPPTAAFPNN